MKSYNTTLQQILQLVPKQEFNKIVKRHNGEGRSKGFTCWSQFCAMVFAQLSGQKGLRGIETGLALSRKKIIRLGICDIKRSTLSYANEHRPHEIYRDLFFRLFNMVRPESESHKFDFKNPLYSVDASVIDLCLNMFRWAHFRKTKAGVKLHVKLDHNGYIPSFVTITNAKCHESKIMEEIPQKEGDVIVFDRGYIDYSYFLQCCKEGIYFVTRSKNNMDFDIIDRHDVSEYENIKFDYTIMLTSSKGKSSCPEKLRLVRSFDPESKKTINIITNNFEWSPEVVSAVYKDRWQIEIFFKTIKQNLKIKRFFGTTENAVFTQIWIVLITFLLLKYLTILSTGTWTVGTLMSIIPIMLFRKEDIFSILNSGISKSPPGSHKKSNQGEFNFV